MRGVSELTSMSYAINRPSPSYRILMYHSVDGEVIGDRLNIFGITKKRFIQHMDILLHNDIDIVELNAKYLSTKSNCLAITFDDGYKDNLYVVAPILAKYSFPFTVFVSTGFVEKESNGFLTPSELRDLAALPNVTIGAHGVKHLELAKCDDEQLRNELLSSKQYIEDVIAKPVTTIGYPHGSVDRRVRNVAESLGYTLGTTSYMDCNRTNQDPLLLARTSILGIDTVRVFNQKITGAWDWYKIKQKNPVHS